MIGSKLEEVTDHDCDEVDPAGGVTAWGALGIVHYGARGLSEGDALGLGEWGHGERGWMGIPSASPPPKNSCWQQQVVWEGWRGGTALGMADGGL